MKMTVMRTVLYVPGCSEEMIASAAKTQADIMVLDLEDMSPPPVKIKAREVVRRNLKVAASGVPVVYVRPNGWESGLTDDDCEAIIDKGVAGVVLPKFGEPDAVVRLDWKLEEIERKKGLEAGSLKIQLMIENAKAMMHVYEVTTASKRVNSIVFGAMDYMADMKIMPTEPMAEERKWARARVACAARAAGVVAIDCPYLGPPEGFEENTLYGRQLGYEGKIIADPSQIEPANRLHTPSPELLEWARGVVKLYEAEAVAKGSLGLTYKGEPILEPMYLRAQRFLEAMADIEAWERKRSKK